MTLTERLQAAYKAWQAPEVNTKSAPWAWGGWDFFQWGNTKIDFRSEAGDLGGSSLIMAAVNWVSTTLPEAPIQVLRAKSAKVWEPQLDHPLTELLAHPTRYITRDKQLREWFAGELLWKAFAYSWILDGNVYFRKVRNALGEPVQFWPEPHWLIRERFPGDAHGTPITAANANEFVSYYEVERDGHWHRIDAEDVLHFRHGLDPSNNRRGMSPVASLHREIFTDNERARYNALIFKNGGAIPFVLSPEAGSATGLKAEEIKAEWEYRTTGDNVGRPMVLTGPVKVQTMGATPDQILIEKASQIPAVRVAAVIGIPCGVLGFEPGLEQVKVGATMRELREQAYESWVIPTWRVIAGELNSQLLPDFGDTKGLKVAHDLSQVRVLMDDRAALFTREVAAYQGGVKTRAEARSALGLDTKPEDEVYFVLAASEKQAEAMPDDAEPQLVNGRDKQKEMVN